jgi:hypothetical protein
MITNDVRYKPDIISRIAVTKAAFNKKKNYFYQHIGFKIKEETIKCYIWCVAL